MTEHSTAWYVIVVSSVSINAPLWWGILTMREAMHEVDGQISLFSSKISCEPITPLKTQVLIKKKRKKIT